MVARPEQPSKRQVHFVQSHGSVPVHGCVTRGLGSSPRQSDDSRCLEPPRQLSPHQLARAKGSFFLGLQDFEMLVTGRSVLVHSDNTTVVAYINKLGGTRSPTLCYLLWELMLWCIDRKILLSARHVPGKLNSITDALSRRKRVLSTGWAIPVKIAHRLFLHWGELTVDLFTTLHEQKTASLCVSDSRSESNGNRRSVNVLERTERVCISPLCTSSNCTEENPRGEFLSHSCSASVAKPRLVPSIAIPSGRLSSSSPRSREPIVSGKGYCSPQPELVPPSRVQIIERSLRSQGFSEQAASVIARPQRDSTLHTYGEKWKRFSDWCRGGQKDPLDPSPQTIADFLLFLFEEKKYAVKTIMVYRTTIANIVRSIGGPEFGQNKIFSYSTPS